MGSPLFARPFLAFGCSALAVPQGPELIEINVFDSLESVKRFHRNGFQLTLSSGFFRTWRLSRIAFDSNSKLISEGGE